MENLIKRLVMIFCNLIFIHLSMSKKTHIWDWYLCYDGQTDKQRSDTLIFLLDNKILKN